MHRDLDLLGVMLLSFVVAFVGGVIRDLLLAHVPLDRRYLCEYGIRQRQHREAPTTDPITHSA
jgi:hypothetical protein